MHVHANGLRLWFDVEGAALVPAGREMRARPTVVLLHGGPGGFDHSYFKPDFGALAQVAQVVYLDLPGHGRSEWGDPATWTFEFAADAVREFCDVLGIERPIVYGHSFGGLVAIVYGMRHPAHGRALVLQSTLARFDLDRMVEDFRRLGGDEIAETIRRVYGGQRASVTPEQWVPCWRLFGPWVTGDEERSRIVVNAALNAPGLDLMREFDVVDGLSAINCPTLVCVGELDPGTPVAAARELYDALPAGNARLEILAGAGHFPWKDVPDVYWPLLTEFVASVQ